VTAACARLHSANLPQGQRIEQRTVIDRLIG
jgi:hypothetical protein